MMRTRMIYLLASYSVLCVPILANQPIGYLGCFDESLINRTVIYWDNNTNSGSQCKKKCQSVPQRYAGTKVRACFCGDAFRKETHTSGCNQKCPGNENEICGDWTKIGVYDTWFCITSPCKNGATCQDINATHYSCDCTPGWTGRLCDAESNRNPIAIYISVPITIALVVVGVITFFILRRRRNQKKDGTSATYHKSKGTGQHVSAVTNEAYINHDIILETPVHINRTEMKEANKNGMVNGEDNNSHYNIIDFQNVSESRIETSVSEDGYEHLNSKITTFCDKTYSHTNFPYPKSAEDFTYSHIDKSAGGCEQRINIHATDSTYNTLNLNRAEKKRKQESKSTDNNTTCNKINMNRNDITDSRKSSDYNHTELRNISVLN